MHINYLAVVIAAVLNMAVGALWYSPLGFAKDWAKATGRKMDEMGSGTNGYVLTAIGSLVMAWALAYLADKIGAVSFLAGAKLGFIVWLGFVATTHAANYVFEGRPLRLYSINVGYFLVSFVLMGGLLASWR